MRIWKLTPLDPAAPIWKLWVPEPVFVRAESEAEARKLAQLATLKTTPTVVGKPIAVNPWVTQDSACVNVTDEASEFSTAGAAAVLRHGEKF